MTTEVKVPELGESVVDATVGRWLKHEGESVAEGDALVELETDKVNMEVPSTAAGTLQSIVKPEGEQVGIGDVLALIDENGAASGSGSQAVTQSPQPAASEGETATAGAAPSSAPAPTRGEEELDEGDGARATPLARRVAAEHGIDLSDVAGTGPGGRVRRDDVTAFLERKTTQAPAPQQVPRPAEPPARPGGAREAERVAVPPAPGEETQRWEERIPMSRRRRTIAQRLVEAQHTAAMLTTFNEVDMTAIMDIRKRRKDAFKERFGVNLGYMSFFTRAVVGALKEFPRLNAEIQGDDMIVKHYYDIGIAVGMEEGLVVPVLRDADRMTFAQIERQIASLAEKARTNTLTLAELQGGTFTISNGGIYGSLLSTPILNAPQVGILGMHKIEERPIAQNGQVVIHPMMYLALSYDHRIVDGNEAVRFLVRVKQLLEDPEALLLEG